ncbi:hypothetical protein TTHERM_00812980 (macronuclear) [Tetrahymena thermophila SB210]|uniref:Transmembrane protein n=1 Tax=Tetrahymena thermophila (strain SB210) TaxID=312017 RepID=Q22ST3_TETTS|nr:hypothetical protein TTHERM_00812980 [Tetrahymena thermophila SB210]EAR88381.1 hypothetical protein TTHERM_00812980 [Tetrahymena thermophila SB210]|eukprot:XP_001008626.1 hypothetical protein TTHERM_00812980 [Tetrahymena thermophila SB210]
MIFYYLLSITLLITYSNCACTNPDKSCTTDCVSIGFIAGTLKDKGPCQSPTACLTTAGACDSTNKAFLQACIIVGYQNNAGTCIQPSYALCSSPGNTLCQTSTLSLCTLLFGLQQSSQQSCGSTTDSLCLASSQGCGSSLYPCVVNNGLIQNVTISQACAPPTNCTAEDLGLCGGTYTYCLSKGYIADSKTNLDCICEGNDNLIQCTPKANTSPIITAFFVLLSILTF